MASEVRWSARARRELEQALDYLRLYQPDAVEVVEEAIAAGNQAAAAEALRAAEPEMMRAAQKGIFHKNHASRKVSRLAHRISTLSA